MKIQLAELRLLIHRILETKNIDSGPFKSGDDVKFGKYKNKSGKIKKIFNDDKDHVAVELEPTPKGRKKNVEVGLYKIWPAEKSNDSG